MSSRLNRIAQNNFFRAIEYASSFVTFYSSQCTARIQAFELTSLFIQNLRSDPVHFELVLVFSLNFLVSHSFFYIITLHCLFL